MTRAQTLGLMAAQLLAGRLTTGWMLEDEPAESDHIKAFVDAADALLREAERVSPEPENPGPTLTYTYDPSSPHPHIWGSTPGHVSEPNT